MSTDSLLSPRTTPLTPLLPLLALLLTSAPLTAADDLAARQARGKTAFATCIACHGADGKGLPTNPPMAPSLVGSKLATGPAEITTAILLKGIAKTDAKYLGIMAPLGATMNDEQIADVLTYIRTSFGNTAAPVAVADVKTWREKYKDINSMLSRSVLEKKAAQLAAETAAPAAGSAPPAPPAAPPPSK